MTEPKPKSKVGAASSRDGVLSTVMIRGESHRIRYELRPKDKTVTLRMSGALLEAIKHRAEQSGIDYQKFIRLTLEHVVQRNQ